MKKKVVVRLQGGLGNQLHQYAYGLLLAKKINGDLFIDCEFLYTHSKKLNITLRDLELNKFNIKNKNYKSLLSSQFVIRVLKRLKLNRYFILFNSKIVLNYTPLTKVIDNKVNFYYLDGIMGLSDDYQEDLCFLLENIKVSKEFYDLTEEVKNKVIGENSVAVHIRRTDYLKPGSIHHVLDLNYYHKAIEYIRAKVDNPVFYVFSDDKNFVNENFANENFKILNYSGKNSAFFDFLAIKSCKHHIIANSTFSWWAAFLGNNAESITIAPSECLITEKLDLKSTYPSKWLVF